MGRHYDLAENGSAMRVVVVGQEAGPTFDPPGDPTGVRTTVSLDERYATVMKIGRDCRFLKDKGHHGRGPQDRGTTMALRALFGRELAADHDGEYIDASGERVHQYDAHALVNVLICSAVRRGSKDGKPTFNGKSSRTMERNCLLHFRRTLQVLDPTCVILQGRDVERWTRDVFTERRSLSSVIFQGKPESSLSAAKFDGRPVLLFTFSHPAAHAPLNWSTLGRPYVSEVLVPTMRRAREYLGLA